MIQPAPSEAEVRAAPEAIADPLSAMTPRFNAFFRWFGRRFLRHLELDPETVATLRSLESRGAVVYVMRYPSRLDYFLFNWLFLRVGLRLAGFANALSFYYYAPAWQALRMALSRLRQRLGGATVAGHELGREQVHELVRAGESLFLFLRAERGVGGRRARRAAREHHELDLVGELVGSVWNDDRPVFLVPLALFWRKGPRHARRFLNLGYGGPTRPTDLAKVTGFLLNYRNLKIKVGEPIDLRAFVSQRRAEGAVTIARKVRRSLLLHLYREEKVVEGPPIQPLHRIEEEIFSDPAFEAALAAWAQAHDRDVDAARAQAREILAEIAASMNSTFLAVLNLVVSSIFRRMFAGVEVSGLEKVADYARQHPIVLVPSHRSYFDFLVLSWLFYGHHMVPPHIAARENMGFGPFGFVFRRAGAFFLRRSFEDPLYKEVFRRYVGYLVREGFTQEFFIEGGRSRTGKTLAPKFGYLTWVVDAFLSGARRDLFFIPTAITYERLVEEGALVRELEGGEKQDESVLGLVRARKFLQRRFGTVFVSFGEPISMAQAVGPRREALARDDADAQEERRRFVEQLGNRLVERINWAAVANATSVAACALLGEPRRGLLRVELVGRMQSIVDLLRIQDVRLTPALVADEGEFRESIAFLLRSDLIRAMPDPRGEILYYEESKRRALDLYRNAIIHFLATPSFLARGLLAGGSPERLRADVADWLELLYQEFFAPREELLAAHVDGFLDYFERRGLVERSDVQLRAGEKGRSYLQFVAAQTRGVIEGYYAACSAALDVGSAPVPARTLLRGVREQFQRGELLGEIRRPEGGNPVTFQNALDFLARRGVLERRSAGGGRERRREITYVRGPAFEELAALRERLAAALRAG
jgi:glycerol-3-phosphate O-acyltransferase